MVQEKPDLVLAFPSPKSIGTHDTIRKARKQGIKTVVTLLE